MATKKKQKIHDNTLTCIIFELSPGAETGNRQDKRLLRNGIYFPNAFPIGNYGELRLPNAEGDRAA